MTASTAGRTLGVAGNLTVRPATLGHGWGELSAILTQLADRYTPAATVRCFPAAAAPAPGLIHRPTATILIDGDLLAATPDQLNLADREHLASLAVLLGVTFHEIGHERHTPHNLRGEVPRELGWALTVLEEPRMEAQVLAEYPEHGPFIRAATWHINLHDLPHRADGRRHAAHIAVLTIGRVHAGTLMPADVSEARCLVQAGLGSVDATVLDSLLARTVRLGDHDHEAMVQAARDLEALIADQPEQPGAGSGENAPGASASAPTSCGGGSPAAESSNGDHPSQDGPPATRASGGHHDDGGSGVGGDDPLRRIRDQLAAAAGRAARSLTGPHPDTHDGALLAEVARRIADPDHGHPDRGRDSGVPGWGIGMPSGELIPPYGNRPAIALERAARRRLAVLLAKATSRRTIREGRVVPPGRFAGGGAVTQAAQRARGAPITGHAFRAKTTVNAGLWRPRLHVYLDNSGSMGAVEAVLGSVIWVTANAVCGMEGSTAVATFGNASQLIVSARRPPRLVPEIRCGGGTDHLAQAIGLCDHDLPLTTRQPRLAVIVSDGLWSDHDGHGARLIDRRRHDGVAVIHVGIGAHPATHGDTPCLVIDHAAVHRLADVIAGGLLDVLANRR